MNDVSITEIGGEALMLAAKLGAPILLTALAVGVLIGMLQTATQLQEATLTFVPKFIAVGAVLLVSGNWMLSSAVTFTHELFDVLPRLLG